MPIPSFSACPAPNGPRTDPKTVPFQPFPLKGHPLPLTEVGILTSRPALRPLEEHRNPKDGYDFRTVGFSSSVLPFDSAPPVP